MTKYFKLQIYFLIVLIIVGSVSGIYALNLTQHDNSGMGISKTNNNGIVHGSKTIYVAKNGTDRNDGLTFAKPKRNIENAIDAANPGDIIKVGKGVYPINLQITKNITLIGDNQKNTVIDGQQKANCIQISGAVVTIINFTIKNGIGPHPMFGGGIHNKGTLTLKNSTVTNNNAEDGGGIYNMGIMTIKESTIKNNTANESSGGIFNSGILSIEDSTVTDNIAEKFSGGGIENTNTMTIKRATIKNNTAKHGGGGIGNGNLLTIEDSTIINNIADWGGGIANAGVLYVYGSTIIQNKANEGGGIFNGEYKSAIAYIDDVTRITDNILNDFQGKSYIPA